MGGSPPTWRSPTAWGPWNSKKLHAYMLKLGNFHQIRWNWRKWRKMGESGLIKLRFSVPIKKVTLYPAKTTHLGCCKPPSNHENSSKASIPFGTIQFHALFFHLPHFSISKPTSRESKHHLSSLEPFNFKPCSSLASYFLFYQITQELDEAFVKLLEIC